MTPSAPDESPSTPPPLSTTPVRTSNPSRGALTRELMGAHRANDGDLPRIPVDEARLAMTARSGANWFYWVAALSIINSVISLSGGHVSFLAGLAIPQVADVYAAHLGYVGPYFSLGTDLVLAFFFCGFGYLTTHGSRAAFIVGMVLYVLDGAVFFLFKLWLPLAFHGFVLFQMIVGWRARQKLSRLRAEPPLASPGI